MVVSLPFLWMTIPFLLNAIKKIVPDMIGPYGELHPTLQESSDEEEENAASS